MDPITATESQDMRKILALIFGPQALSWMIKYASYEALGKLIITSPRGAHAQYLVPQPHLFSSPFKWDKPQVRVAIVKYFGTDEGKQALIGMRATGLAMQADFEAARYAGY